MPFVLTAPPVLSMTPLSINGGGIAGLCAAIALARKGFDVTIYEKAIELSEIGAGIQLSPNALYCLNKLGVELKDGVTPQEIQIFGNNFIAKMPMGVGFRTLKRADLQRILLSQALALGVKLTLNASHETPDIFADGVHSTSRGKPIFSGYTAHRAMLKLPTEPIVKMWLTGGAHLVAYPVSSNEMNLVITGSPHAQWPLEAQKLIDKCDFTKWPIFTHNYKGGNRIGDACHAMHPFLAQGATMGIEDGYLLGECYPDWERFHALRKARVTRIMRAAKRNGFIYHLPFPLSLPRDIVMRYLSGEKFYQRQAWIYDYK